jgi:hypothetical protein
MIRVDPETTALVVVDMQNDFCSADGYYATVGRDISKLAECAGPVAALLARARQARMTIVFTRLLHDEARGSMEQRHTIRPRRWTASGERLMPGRGRGRDRRSRRAADHPGQDGYSAFEEPASISNCVRGIKTVILAGSSPMRACWRRHFPPSTDFDDPRDRRRRQLEPGARREDCGHRRPAARRWWRPARLVIVCPGRS